MLLFLEKFMIVFMTDIVGAGLLLTVIISPVKWTYLLQLGMYSSSEKCSVHQFLTEIIISNFAPSYDNDGSDNLFQHLSAFCGGLYESFFFANMYNVSKYGVKKKKNG